MIFYAGASKQEPTAATVVLSRIPPEEPALAAQFEALCAEFAAQKITVSLVDSIYDEYEFSRGVEFLRGVTGELIFLGWHYPRALKWILARQNIEVNGATRKLHCLDVREPAKAAAIVLKVKDIIAGRADAIVKPLPTATGIGVTNPPTNGAANLTPKERGALAETELEAPANAELSPRWYPVIDYDQCTNCMECMDFCLFGVYGVDAASVLRVVQQDQCRQDCPACSRVCPVGAIVFPKYKTNQTIAGSIDAKDDDRGSLKLDLSKIFGKPKARHQAALERDRELIKAGRSPASAKKVEKLAGEIDRMEL